MREGRERERWREGGREAERERDLVHTNINFDHPAFQAKRIKDLEDEYQQKLATLQKEFNTERYTNIHYLTRTHDYEYPCLRSMMVAHHQQEMKDLSDVEYAMQLRYDERESRAEEDHQSLMDELKNKVSSNI